MKALRTPDACFDGLPDYDFAPNYLMVDDTEGSQLRVHYVDEGPRAAAPVLMMHGEPSWSYLYRHVIVRMAGQGHRVVAPDFVGFGRSDKPVERSDYTYQRHANWMVSVLTHLDLSGLGRADRAAALGGNAGSFCPCGGGPYGPAERGSPDEKGVRSLARL